MAKNKNYSASIFWKSFFWRFFTDFYPAPLDRSQSLFYFVPQENLTVKLARLSGWANLPSSSWLQRRRGSTSLRGPNPPQKHFSQSKPHYDTHICHFLNESGGSASLWNSSMGEMGRWRMIPWIEWQLFKSYETRLEGGWEVRLRSGWRTQAGTISFFSDWFKHPGIELSGSQFDSNKCHGRVEEEMEEQRRHQGRKNWEQFCEKLQVQWHQSKFSQNMQCRQNSGTQHKEGYLVCLVDSQVPQLTTLQEGRGTCYPLPTTKPTNKSSELRNLITRYMPTSISG